MTNETQLTPTEYVGRVLNQLTLSLKPFVEAELRRVYQDKWIDHAKQGLLNSRDWFRQDGIWWDSYLLLSVMINHWNDVFLARFEKGQRSLIFELLDIRNRWAHERPFKTDDAFRAADSAVRLLEPIAKDGAASVGGLRESLLSMMSQPSVPRTPAGSREGHSQSILKYLRSIAPKGATNSEIAEQTGIHSHQTVFAATRTLARQNLVRGEAGTELNRREWTFYAMPPK